MGEVDFEKLERDYQKSKGNVEYKGKQDYAQKMSMEELDEYAKRLRAGGDTGGQLRKMGQDALAYSREYERLCQDVKSGKITPPKRKIVKAVPPKAD